MASPQCPNLTGGCPKNAANGGCRNRETCCKEKSDFQQAIQDYTDQINQYKLQKRLLSDKFKKRSTSKCDGFKNLSKSSFEKQLDALQSKIDTRIKNIKNLKNAKKASLTVRDREGDEYKC